MADRRSFLRLGLSATAGALASPYVSWAAPRHAARVVDLVDCTTVIDMLSLLTLDWKKLRAWASDPASFGAAELALLKNSGIRVFHPAVDPNAKDGYAGALSWMKRWRGVLANQSQHLMPILGPADLERVVSEGKIGVVMGLQSSAHFRTTADVAAFHALGQRVSQLTYDERGALGSGCRDPRGGLTPLGVEVVAEMNRVGMAVDLSHCGEHTTLDAMRASNRPVLLTHANCLAVAQHPRNKSDVVLRELRRTGGVIGITSVRAFVRPARAASLGDLLDHFEHAIRVAGIEHVGLGSDCDVDPRNPWTGRVSEAYAIQGLEHPRRTYDIAAGLLDRGYSESDVALVLGGNFRRALGEIWGTNS